MRERKGGKERGEESQVKIGRKGRRERKRGEGGKIQDHPYLNNIVWDTCLTLPYL